MLIQTNRNFGLLWISQIFATLADVLYNVGIMVLIYETTNSAFATAVVGFIMTIPPFVLGPFAGPLADRLSRRQLLMSIHALRAVALVPLLFFEAPPIWLNYTLVGVLSVFSTFNTPARLALVPTLVEPDELVKANSWFMGILPLSYVLGFAVGPYLLAQLGIPLLSVLIMALYLLATAITTLLPSDSAIVAAQQAEKPAESLRTALVDGWNYLRDHNIARPLVVMETFEHFPHGVWTAAVLLVFTEQKLGASSTVWGWQNAAFYAAMFTGASLGLMLAKPIGRRPGQFIAINALIAAALTLAFSLTSSVTFSVINAFMFGVPFAIRDVAQDALLQDSVDNSVLGRVFAFREMGRNIVFTISGLGFAYLADSLDVRTIYQIGAFLYLCSALYVFSNRAVRTSQITMA